jgi:hypothetical protein
MATRKQKIITKLEALMKDIVTRTFKKKFGLDIQMNHSLAKGHTSMVLKNGEKFTKEHLVYLDGVYCGYQETVAVIQAMK